MLYADGGREPHRHGHDGLNDARPARVTPEGGGPPLRALLGRPRARLSAPLAEPATATELGHRLNVTPAAVSRRLPALATAHLVDRTP
ncbi:hypothetical protein [Streptomyces roseolus]|uniref:hypothetical protein n=1 Tax=Streptomyces roseolus TaxID=67358 RepID=UPI0037B9E136